MSTIPDNTDDIPSLVAEEIHAAQIANIPPPDQPRYVADRIRLRIAGRVDYTRKRALSPAQRKELILRKFNGRNIAELAEEYNLTTRRVEQIVYENKSNK